jgi:adenylate cyclase class 2
MFEVEMKFPALDAAALEERLRRLGAREAEARSEVDVYFNAPDRDFARTDEALRLRRIGETNFVTYKGPKLDARTKTRAEIEVAFADGAKSADDFAQLLTRLGYRATAEVRKERRRFHLTWEGLSFEISLDSVAEVGSFVEVEILADQEGLEPARAALLRLAEALELTDSERRSYLELLLKTREKAS